MPEKRFDLKERTLNLSKSVIDLCKDNKKDLISKILISQVIRSSSSIGANYREADNAQTKKEFIYRINICRKEAVETMYWLELIEYVQVDIEIEKLIQACKELSLIFVAIIKKAKLVIKT